MLDDLLRLFAPPTAPIEEPTAVQALLAIGLAFALALLVVSTYRGTHRGAGYSQAFAQTLVLMSVVSAVVMLVIGSHLARAFSLVGALSIIRFRTAIKEPRDVAFLFFALASGMAVGTQFYALALAFTALVCAICVAMDRMNLGAQRRPELVLRVLGDRQLDPRGPLRLALTTRAEHETLLSAEALDPELTELVFALRLREGASELELLSELRGLPGLRRASILPGQHLIPV